jgi:hypothetical protein
MTATVEDELVELRHRLAVIEGDKAAIEAAEAEKRRQASLSRGQWEREMLLAQEERMGLPPRMLDAARQTAQQLMQQTGWKLGPRTTVPDDQDPIAAREWWDERVVGLRRYVEAVAVKRRADPRHANCVGMAAADIFDAGQAAAAAVRNAESELRRLGLAK